jgi:hypothetical protein
MAQRMGICVYCGGFRPITEDHIPPKALFRRPLPPDLVKVPSCTQCNGGASKDDEYFKTMMVLKERAGDHPDAAGLRDSVFRSFDNPRKRGFRRHIARITRPVNVRSPAGLYLGRTLAYDVDFRRLDRVVVRITRGLFWHHYGRRVPEDHLVESYGEHGFNAADPVWLEHFKRTIAAPILMRGCVSMGRGVMRYWHSPVEGLPDGTAWIYEFYGDVRFIAVTLPRVHRVLQSQKAS